MVFNLPFFFPTPHSEAWYHLAITPYTIGQPADTVAMQLDANHPIAPNFDESRRKYPYQLCLQRTIELAQPQPGNKFLADAWYRLGTLPIRGGGGGTERGMT